MEDEEGLIKVWSIAEEHRYIAGLECTVCGGRYSPKRQALLLSPAGPRDTIEIECRQCGHKQNIHFDISEFFGTIK